MRSNILNTCSFGWGILTILTKYTGVKPQWMSDYYNIALLSTYLLEIQHKIGLAHMLTPLGLGASQPLQFPLPESTSYMMLTRTSPSGARLVCTVHQSYVWSGLFPQRRVQTHTRTLH